MRIPKVYPVIHHVDDGQTVAQAVLAEALGADGVFLISHRGENAEIIALRRRIKELRPDFPVGLNLLGESLASVTRLLAAEDVDMVWFDNAGVDSRGASIECVTLRKIFPSFPLLAGVDFKGQAHEPHPAMAVQMAKDAGYVPTTSGPRTGVPPEVEKIRLMSEPVDGELAVASGIAPENVDDYKGMIGYILVATAICDDREQIIPPRQVALQDKVRAW